MSDLVGREIGNFVVKAQLGAGAMGAVYLGEHSILGHKVAIKVMAASLLAQHAEQGIQRFITEARALTQIQDSPHVIKLYDFGQLDGGVLYYVMEHLEGHDLEHELRGKLPLSPEQALAHIEQIAAGLGAAHDQQIVHRDLKPANVYVVTSGDTLRLKLIDFGLAKNLATLQQITVGGMGTPLYAAPEQVVPGEVPIGPATDLYALGVMLYQMLSNDMPFDISPDAHPYAVLMAPLHDRRIPLCERRPELHAAIGAFVDGTLAKTPEGRPASAAAFVEGYRAALAIASGAPASIPATRSDAPVVSAPVVSAPVVSAPVVSAPVVSAPAVSRPAVSPPAASTPTPVANGTALAATALPRTEPPFQTTLGGAASEIAVKPDETALVPAKRRAPLVFGIGAGAVVIAAVAFWATSGPGSDTSTDRDTTVAAGRGTARPDPPTRSAARDVPLTVKVAASVRCTARLDGKPTKSLPRSIRVHTGQPRRLRVSCSGHRDVARLVRAKDGPIVVAPELILAVDKKPKDRIGRGPGRRPKKPPSKPVTTTPKKAPPKKVPPKKVPPKKVPPKKVTPKKVTPTVVPPTVVPPTVVPPKATPKKGTGKGKTTADQGEVVL